MLQNLGISSIIFLTSQLLVIAQQGTGNIHRVGCKNIKGVITIHNEEGLCRCSTSVTANDGHGYAHGVSTYKFHGEPKTWNEARKICEKDHSHLAIVDSDLERRVLLDLMELHMVKLRAVNGTPSTDRHVWLGIHDQFQEGEWSNVFGEPFGYTAWANMGPSCFDTHQPDNGLGIRQNCGTLVRNNCGYMDDVQCHWILPFFCEKPYTCFV